MYPTRKEIIDSLLPERSILLISGCSGAGKTILTLQSIEEWFTKSTFLGFSAKTNPRIVYFSYDRNIEDAYDTMNKLGVYFPDMKVYSGLERNPVEYPSNTTFETNDCVIIDGIDFMVDSANDTRQVKECLHKFQILIKGTHCSIIATSGSGKAKPGESYSNSRERSIGSSAWSRLTGTNINIVYDEMALVNTRTIYITPRTGDKTILEMDFNEKGRMVPSSANSDDDRLTNFYKFLPETFSTAAAIEIGQGLKLSQATVYRYVNRLLSDGRISKIQHGIYKKMPLN